MLTLNQYVSAQDRDSAFHARVDEREKIIMDHFIQAVSDDAALVDTVSYVQHLLASHIEVIRLRTDSESNRKSMYAYALKLRNQRFKSILPTDIWKAYAASFDVELSGFIFCRVCDLAPLAGRNACGNCGEPYK